jgi:hypothetical protein
VNESQNIQLSKEGTNLIQTELTTLKRIKWALLYSDNI